VPSETGIESKNTIYQWRVNIILPRLPNELLPISFPTRKVPASRFILFVRPNNISGLLVLHYVHISFVHLPITVSLLDQNTVQLHLSGLIGKANHPEMRKIRINGFFLNRLHRHFQVGKKISTKGYLWKHIYSRTNKILFRRWPSTFTAEEDFGNSLPNLGTPSAVTIYSMYLRLNLPTTPDLKF